MQNSKFDTASEYYSGQGVVMLGVRDAATGKAKYFTPIGNVSDLKIDIATSVIDHKGAQDGQRAIDKRIQTETKATASMTMESWSQSNLAKALRGSSSTIAAGTAFAENITLYAGQVVSLSKLAIAVNLALVQGATPLIGYVDDLTPWDYKANFDAGSVKFNDGLVTPPSALGTVATGVTVGATTTITIANTLAAGDSVYLYGFTGADAASLNGKRLSVVSATAANFVVAVNTTAKTITTAAGSKVVMDGATIGCTYDYGLHYQVDALTQPLTEIAVRFEGLNTANGNAPVVIDLFKFAADPLKELSLISDTFGKFELQGALLYDATQATGSKFFKVRKLS